MKFVTSGRCAGLERALGILDISAPCRKNVAKARNAIRDPGTARIHTILDFTMMPTKPKLVLSLSSSIHGGHCFSCCMLRTTSRPCKDDLAMIPCPQPRLSASCFQGSPLERFTYLGRMACNIESGKARRLSVHRLTALSKAA